MGKSSGAVIFLLTSSQLWREALFAAIHAAWPLKTPQGGFGETFPHENWSRHPSAIEQLSQNSSLQVRAGDGCGAEKGTVR